MSYLVQEQRKSLLLWSLSLVVVQMPPKGSAKLPSEADFRYNEDRTKVECRACSSGVPPERRTWIELRSAAAHLRYPTHLKSVEQLEDTRCRHQALENERRAESAASGLQDLVFAAQRMEGPVTGHSSDAPTQAEIEMWDEYHANGASFDAGEEKNDPNVQKTLSPQRWRANT
ncbi:hypothetical protein B0H10DRAFT_2322823 [Mycena sp. CBHHK59/15]|nr:hypothetical protein B0H10DRAFT_2322823 [Mycena sp. CBHHK59/15]